MSELTVANASAQMKIVIVGHVDHGKSTLVGRLFHDTGSLPDGKLEQLQKAAESRGAPFEWANLMDALQSERDQNITIDAAQIWFRTKRRQYVLIDAPGHKEFLKNMMTGAAGAATALILIDAAEGIRDDSRRHGYLLGLLGIREVAVLVNKMDLVGYDESRFLAIEAEYRQWLGTVGVAPRVFVPIAARHGDNVAIASARMPWYQGPTVLEALDEFDAPVAAPNRPLRFPIQDVYRFDERRILAGRVESGTIRVGDRVVFSPSDKASTVRTIERWNAAPSDEAHEGESVGITLTEQVFVERGAIAAKEQAPPRKGTRLAARVFWLSRKPLEKGKSYKLKLATSEAVCDVESIDSVIDPTTLVAAAGESAVKQHEIAEVILRARSAIAFDTFGENASTGRFVVVDGCDVVGGGIVRAGGGVQTRIGAELSRPLIVSRNGHAGCVLWLTGASGPAKRKIAAELQRALLARGRHAYVLDDDTIAGGLCSDLALSPRDRKEQVRRIGEVAKLFDAAGVVCIAALSLSLRDEKDWIRGLVPDGRFVEAQTSQSVAQILERLELAGENEEVVEQAG
jgi:bifunctional enzyme CysN/CysC